MIKYIIRLCQHMCPAGCYIASTCAFRPEQHGGEHISGFISMQLKAQTCRGGGGVGGGGAAFLRDNGCMKSICEFQKGVMSKGTVSPTKVHKKKGVQQ